jgi:hypothetical protein
MGFDVKISSLKYINILNPPLRAFLKAWDTFKKKLKRYHKNYSKGSDTKLSLKIINFNPIFQVKSHANKSGQEVSSYHVY